MYALANIYIYTHRICICSCIMYVCICVQMRMCAYEWKGRLSKKMILSEKARNILNGKR